MSGFDLQIDIDGADELAAAFAAAPEEMSTSLFPVVKDQASGLQRTWRAAARKSAGSHGKHYPSSITTDLMRGEGAIWADIGPDSAMPQGGMGRGFEYGSVHTPPHPDGAAAFSTSAPKFVDAVDAEVGRIIGEAL